MLEVTMFRSEHATTQQPATDSDDFAHGDCENVSPNTTTATEIVSANSAVCVPRDQARCRRSHFLPQDALLQGTSLQGTCTENEVAVDLVRSAASTSSRFAQATKVIRPETPAASESTPVKTCHLHDRSEKSSTFGPSSPMIDEDFFPSSPMDSGLGGFHEPSEECHHPSPIVQSPGMANHECPTISSSTHTGQVGEAMCPRILPSPDAHQTRRRGQDIPDSLSQDDNFDDTMFDQLPEGFDASSDNGNESVAHAPPVSHTEMHTSLLPPANVELSPGSHDMCEVHSNPLAVTNVSVNKDLVTAVISGSERSQTLDERIASNVVSSTKSAKQLEREKQLQMARQHHASVACASTARTFEADPSPTPTSAGLVFSTGSGKRVEIDPKALQKAKLLLREVPPASTKVAQYPRRQQQQQGSAAGAAGFTDFGVSTGSGKSVEIDPEALEKAKLLLSEVPPASTKVAQHPRRHQQQGSAAGAAGSIGFSTGSGNRVEINPKALEKARLLLSEAPSASTNVAQHLRRQQQQGSLAGAAGSSSVGFSTGSGKRVEIDPKALQKAKLLLGEAPPASAKVAQHPQRQQQQQQGPAAGAAASTDIGFSTGSGKSVEINPKALEQAKLLLSEVPPALTVVAQHPRRQQPRGSTTGTPGSSSIGFATGSGKRVEIDPKALETAKLLLGEAPPASTKVAQRPRMQQQLGSAAGAAASADSVFSTGSGKRVDVDPKALEKAKLLLSEAPPASSKVTQHPRGQQHQHPAAGIAGAGAGSSIAGCSIGFSTGSGKTVEIDPKAFEKAQLLLSEVPTVSTKATQHPRGQQHQHPAAGTAGAGSGSSIGFSTGSGKSVEIDPKALEKAKLLLSEAPPASTKVAPHPRGQQRQHPAAAAGTAGAGAASSIGFSTGSGKSVEIDPKAFEKAQLLLSEVPTVSTKVTQHPRGQQHQHPAAGTAGAGSGSSIGFSTGSGKSVEIDPKALEKAKLLLSEAPPASTKVAPHPRGQQRQHPAAAAGTAGAGAASSIGFSTGSGKSVEIDPKALEKAKLLLSEAPPASTKVAPHPRGQQHQHPAAAAGTAGAGVASSIGFSTGSGKSVEIDPKALEKAKLLLGEAPTESTKVAQHPRKQQHQHPAGITGAGSGSSIGFSTGNGRNVEIDSEALEKAKLLLGEEPVSTKEMPKTRICKHTAGASADFGFSTGSGKSVEIDPKALEKAKLLLQDDAGAESSRAFAATSGTHDNQRCAAAVHDVASTAAFSSNKMSSSVQVPTAQIVLTSKRKLGAMSSPALAASSKRECVVECTKSTPSSPVTAKGTMPTGLTVRSPMPDMSRPSRSRHVGTIPATTPIVGRRAPNHHSRPTPLTERGRLTTPHAAAATAYPLKRPALSAISTSMRKRNRRPPGSGARTFSAPRLLDPRVPFSTPRRQSSTAQVMASSKSMQRTFADKMSSAGTPVVRISVDRVLVAKWFLIPASCFDRAVFCILSFIFHYRSHQGTPAHAQHSPRLVFDLEKHASRPKSVPRHCYDFFLLCLSSNCCEVELTE